MTDRPDCIDEILKSIKDRRDRKYVADHLDELDERASAAEDGSPRERYARAAKEMLEEQAEQSAVRRRAIKLQALAQSDNISFVKGLWDSDSLPMHHGIEALLVGINRQAFDVRSRRGNRLSAAAIGVGAQRHLFSGFENDLARIAADNPQFRGLDALFASGKIENDIFIEKGELEAGAGGRPGRTKNAAALKIAETMVKWDKVEMQMLNDAGAWITPRQRHLAEVTHDANKMRRAAKPYNALDPRTYIYAGWTSKSRSVQEANRQAWAAKTLQYIDAKRMFGTEVDADKKLAEMYGGLITGDHLKMVTIEDGPMYANVAGKVSAKRAFVFKSADAQLAYMKEFGRFNATEQWIHTKRTAAMQYGLMKTFGPVPKEGLEQIINFAKNTLKGTADKDRFNKWAPDLETGGGGALRNRYAVLSGESSIPVANMASGLVAGTLAVQRWSKLGLTPLAIIADNATISRELARQGIAYIERNSGLVSGYFRGGEESHRREVAKYMGTGLTTMQRGAGSRWDVSDAKSGTISYLDNLFFKWSGNTPMTENKREWAEHMMAHHLGDQRGKAFAELGGEEQRMLGAFGIGDKEWALLNKAEWTTVEGVTYLSPDAAQRIPSADLVAHLQKGGSISERAIAAREAPDEAALDRARQDLAMKLWAYYADRGQHAVLDVGPREMAMMYQGTQTGTPLNVALRLVLQFKQFPVAMMTRAWGAEINGGGSTMGKITGMIELAVASTIYGMMTNYLNELAKGQDPHRKIVENPGKWLLSGFLRGGAASIYGDFLLGEWNRFGLPASSTILGPTLGQIDKIAELWADITHPELIGGDRKASQTGALALQLARSNLPAGNMLYTKIPVDYLFYYRLQDWMNPGYLARREQFMKRKQNTEYWLSPSRDATVMGAR
jgi:hypothetical protein